MSEKDSKEKLREKVGEATGASDDALNGPPLELDVVGAAEQALHTIIGGVSNVDVLLRQWTESDGYDANQVALDGAVEEKQRDSRNVAAR
eukprot:9096914-Prorocentrum_lima.AAC.1